MYKYGQNMGKKEVTDLPSYITNLCFGYSIVNISPTTDHYPVRMAKLLLTPNIHCDFRTVEMYIPLQYQCQCILNLQKESIN